MSTHLYRLMLVLLLLLLIGQTQNAAGQINNAQTPRVTRATLLRWNSAPADAPRPTGGAGVLAGVSASSPPTVSAARPSGSDEGAAKDERAARVSDAPEPVTPADADAMNAPAATVETQSFATLAPMAAAAGIVPVTSAAVTSDVVITTPTAGTIFRVPVDVPISAT
ncbi:MAG TPA: hypothetical protein VE775_07895, partial [Pyrinomonadaceae bacterium]|nr:hypothetical protein [Pyrinomonadaceae bacterium]